MQARWIIVPVVFSALGAGAVALFSPGKKPDSAPAPAAPESSAAVVHGFGYAEPASELRRLSLKGDGVIAECWVAVGERVEKGATILQLGNEEDKVALAGVEEEVEPYR